MQTRSTQIDAVTAIGPGGRQCCVDGGACGYVNDVATISEVGHGGGAASDIETINASAAGQGFAVGTTRQGVVKA